MRVSLPYFGVTVLVAACLFGVSCEKRSDHGVVEEKDSAPELDEPKEAKPGHLTVEIGDEGEWGAVLEKLNEASADTFQIDLEPGGKLQLTPKSVLAKTTEPVDPVVISVVGEDTLYDGETVPSIELVGRLKEYRALVELVGDKPLVIVEGEEATPQSKMKSILKSCSEAGVGSIALTSSRVAPPIVQKKEFQKSIQSKPTK